MNTEDKIALIKKHSLNPDADYSDSWILKLLDEMEYRSQINLLVRLESAVGRMMILHENKWIEVDDYRQQLSNPFKKLTAYDESIRSVSTDHTEPIESPEIDKEEELVTKIEEAMEREREAAEHLHPTGFYLGLEHALNLITRKP